MTRDAKITSEIMASVRSRNTRPELAVRKRLWSLGYRYRIHPSGIIGRPDLAFVGLRVAVFIDGDFWHGNPREWKRRGCEKFEDMFPSRAEWWTAKIRRNIERDRVVTRELRAASWCVVRCWESSISRDLEGEILRIAGAVENSARRRRCA
ncbi:MAG: very short patch repair endonuclease [Acidobacteriota bacterium]